MPGEEYRVCEVAGVVTICLATGETLAGPDMPSGLLRSQTLYRICDCCFYGLEADRGERNDYRKKSAGDK